MRRLGSQEQRPMSLDEAVAALGAEAVPPDLRRDADGTIPAAGAALDGRHVDERTVA